MNPDTIKTFLLYSLAFNYSILIIWFGLLTLARDSIYRLQSRWFSISVETFDAINYASIALYKIGVFILNVAPLVALWLL
jgi:hypothetical protein